ncbi:hypothetical protein NZA98_33165 [Escherichia coli]|nr:hypothetical protein [Escherichia coli]
MRAGIDATTGEVLTGWDHCVQSIRKCLTTRVNTRVMRRHLGNIVPQLQDQNADATTIFQVYISVADALNDPEGGEPGFNLRTIELVEYGRSGRFVFLLQGDYFPLGHIGDFSIREDRTLPFASGGIAL